MNPRLQKPENFKTRYEDSEVPAWVNRSPNSEQRILEWVEVPVGDSWVVAYRVVVRDGRMLIAEMRLFPAEAPVAGHVCPPGTWSGTWNPQAPVPGRGITAGLLKKQVQISILFDHIDELRKEMETHAVQYWAERGVDVSKKKSTRGRKAKPDRFYAEIARDYAQACAAGSRRPAADVAEARGISSDLARSFVRRARDKGFLTMVPTGQKGGQLTDDAKRVLRSKRSQKKAGRDGKKKK